MPAERPISKASENRRATKPIMEKRRRARINQCLSELKSLILDALNKDPSRHSKLEKADILEMTVRHLQNIQRQQMAAAISTDSSVLNKFKAGFSECATEVTRYISRLEGVDPALRTRLLAHLSNCLSTLSHASGINGLTQSVSGMLSVQIPTIRPDINNNDGGKFFAGVSVIPSRLPNGEFAFLLPSSQTVPGYIPSSSLSSSLPSSATDRNSQSSVIDRTSHSSSLDRNSQTSLPERNSQTSIIERNSQSSVIDRNSQSSVHDRNSQSSLVDRNSRGSWSPTSPSSKRSASPMSEDNVVLSPTCSDAGSDVFIEPYHRPTKEMILSPVPRRQSPVIHRHSPFPLLQSSNEDRHVIQVPRVQLPSESESVWRPW